MRIYDTRQMAYFVMCDCEIKDFVFDENKNASYMLVEDTDENYDIMDKWRTDTIIRKYNEAFKNIMDKIVELKRENHKK